MQLVLLGYYVWMYQHEIYDRELVVVPYYDDEFFYVFPEVRHGNEYVVFYCL